MAKYFAIHVQIQHSFNQQPHSEILLHLRKNITDSAQPHLVTQIPQLLCTEDAPFTPMKKKTHNITPQIWTK
jgi:hypothetical protein